MSLLTGRNERSSRAIFRVNAINDSELSSKRRLYILTLPGKVQRFVSYQRRSHFIGAFISPDDPSFSPSNFCLPRANLFCSLSLIAAARFTVNPECIEHRFHRVLKGDTICNTSITNFSFRGKARRPPRRSFKSGARKNIPRRVKNCRNDRISFVLRVDIFPRRRLTEGNLLGCEDQHEIMIQH